MRTLKFIVDGQTIMPDPTCDFEGLVPGTEEYVECEFLFSAEWAGFSKVVAFYSMLGHEYEPKALRDGRRCMIPPDALKRRKFKLRVIGKKEDVKLTTNKVEIHQKGGNV